jgi:hypothetical protein
MPQKKAVRRKLLRRPKKPVPSTPQKRKEVPVEPKVTESTVVETIVKKRRKKASKMYFTQETEDAILLYQKEPNSEIRDNIYRDKIEFPMQKLVECVFNRFRFIYFQTGPQDVQREALAHVVSNLDKFDRWKIGKDGKKPKAPRKAYSYFSVVAKNWFILGNNNNYRDFQTHIPISEERSEDTIQLQQVDKHHAQAEMDEFMALVIDFWEENISKIFNKQRDLDIANAVIELLRHAKRIDAFNKKSLYLHIRDISNCKTQQITKVINRMKQYHRNIHKMYVNDGVVSKSLHLT